MIGGALGRQNPRETMGATLEAGQRLGPYRIEARLGEGGMGIVFRATHVGDGGTVALKVLREELNRDEAYRRRLAREARAAAEVDHPHLARVLAVGEADGHAYLAVRYVAGRSLAERLRAEGPLAPPALLRLAAEVGAGLDALRDRGLVHRDVKPANVLMAADGGAVLGDFGLAKGQADTVLTRPGQVLGTLDYLAPELIRGDPATAMSDLYALGCVVFECIAGAPPFAGRGILQTGMAHLEEEPGDPAAARDDLPPAVSWTVRQALAKDPRRRPPNGTAFARMLRLAATGNQTR
jgi:serine/threonine protein kinase